MKISKFLYEKFAGVGRGAGGGEGRAELNGGIFLARVGVAGDIILGKYGNANLVL